MPTKRGLQFLDANGEVYFDLAKRPTLYLGEADIIPTVSTGACSGVINTQFLETNVFAHGLFYEIKKLYINSIDIVRHGYAFPELSHEVTSDGHYRINWEYYNSSYINIGVRIAYGVY